MRHFRAITNQTVSRELQNTESPPANRRGHATFRNQAASRDDDVLTVSPLLDRRNPRDRIKFFTIAEVAEMLRVATRTVRRRIASGELTAHRFGGAVRIAEGDLRAFLALHREG
jgi:excisionase family DNA binding protein